jgi:hypothetical protein
MNNHFSIEKGPVGIEQRMFCVMFLTLGGKYIKFQLQQS